MRPIRTGWQAWTLAAALAALAGGCTDSSTAPRRLLVQLSAVSSSIASDGMSAITVRVTNDQGTPATGFTLEMGSNLGALVVRNSVTDTRGETTATLLGDGARGVSRVAARVIGRDERGEVEVRIGLD